MPDSIKAPDVQILQAWKGGCTHFLCIGMGGSSLGAEVLAQYANPSGLGTPELIILDHVDATVMKDLEEHLPWATTGVLAVSKSGTTPETLSGLNMALRALQRSGENWNDRLLIVTEKKPSPLMSCVKTYGAKWVEHPGDIGGRYSVGTATALLAAHLKGLDVQEFAKGMRASAESFWNNPATHPALQGAVWHVDMAKAGKTETVLLAYGERLRKAPLWWQQLWAESLGKNGHATRPYPMWGPCHQHSTMQMMLDGGADRIFTVIIPATLHEEMEEPSLIPQTSLVHPALLQRAMAEGTVQALAEKGHPVRVLHMPENSAYHLGAWMLNSMLETVITGMLWNINPFDQPAVEAAKNHARAAIGRLTRNT